MKPDGDPNAKGLHAGDIWDIVNYVQSLPYESISNPLDAARRGRELSERCARAACEFAQSADPQSAI